MKPAMTRIVSLGLAICLSLSMMAAASAADTDIDIRDIDLYEVMLTADGRVAWYYDAATGVVVADLDEDGNVVWWETTLKTLWGDRYTPPEAAPVRPSVPETGPSTAPEKAPSGNGAAPNAGPAAAFHDVPVTHWGYNDISECARLGIVAGFEDGSFRPENNVTSVQFIVMLTRTFYNSDVENYKTKPAAAENAWWWPNLRAAQLYTLDNSITVEEKAMNRYDMAQSLANLLNIKGLFITSNDKKLTNAIFAIKDWNGIPTNRQTAVSQCYARGIITGMSDGSFSGSGSMTRAQACAVIMRMLKLVNNYNPGDADNSQYDDGKNQDTGNDQNQQSTGTLANGQPATVENVQAILEEIKQEYPTGTIWGGRDTANTNYYAAGPSNPTDGTRDIGILNRQFKSQSDPRSSTDLQYGCGGWACMVSERIFGKTGAPGRQVTSISEMRPGDIIFKINPKTGYLTHVSIVYKVAKINGTWYYSSCDGNINNGVVVWNENPDSNVISNQNTTKYVYTRYPE